MQKDNEQLIENIDFSIFNSVKHISLNDDDIIIAFYEYLVDKKDLENNNISVYKKRLFKNFQFLNENIFDNFLAQGDFLNIVRLSTRQAVTLAMLAISLDNKITAVHFKEICNTISIKQDKDSSLISLLEKQILLDNKLKIRTELNNFFKNYSKDIFSTILSKNKDFTQEVENTQTKERTTVFNEFIDQKF